MNLESESNFSSKQLIQSLVSGIETFLTAEFIEYAKTVHDDFEKVELCAQDVHTSLEELLNDNPQDNQKYICDKYCFSIYKGLIEENISAY